MSVKNSSSSWFGSLDLTIACWVIVHTFFLILICFQNHFFQEKTLSNTIRVSTSLDLDKDRRIVGPHLGPNSFQMLFSNDKSRCYKVARKHMTCLHVLLYN